MTVTVFMTTTLNGLIAGADDETPWTDMAWQHYIDIVNTARAIVVGRRTYELMLGAGDFDKFKDVECVILSNQTFSVPAGTSFAKTPAAAIAILQSHGRTNIVVGGGAQCNRAFLESGLVDNIWLDIEPFVFGQGLPLLSTSGDVRLDLKLTSVERLGDDTLSVKYQVVKD